MRFLRPVVAGAVIASGLGCHSAFVEATVVNHTVKPVALVEVDYPSASFGTQDLQPGGEYHYRFKVLGTGPLKLVWNDAANQEHTLAGPELREGDEGKLTVTFAAGGPGWGTSLTNHGQRR